MDNQHNPQAKSFHQFQSWRHTQFVSVRDCKGEIVKLVSSPAARSHIPANCTSLRDRCMRGCRTYTGWLLRAEGQCTGCGGSSGCSRPNRRTTYAIKATWRIRDSAGNTSRSCIPSLLQCETLVAEPPSTWGRLAASGQLRTIEKGATQWSAYCGGA